MHRRSWVAALATVSLVAFSTVPSAGASPRQRLRAPDGLFNLPSAVCSVITPIHETNALDILGELLDDDRYSVLGAILFAASALGCGKAEEQSLLVAQSSLAQAIANDVPRFRSFTDDLGTVVPSLRRQAGPAVAEFAFPTVSLSTGAVGPDSLVPVTVRWLQVGGAAADRVDIEARIFLTATSATPWQVITSGLSDLAPGTGLLNAHSVSLVLRGDTYWELCIRASSSGLFAPYACGWRFSFDVDASAAGQLNLELVSSGKGCFSFFGSQVSVAAAASGGVASFYVDGQAATFPTQFDRWSFTREVPFADPYLAYGEHTVCIYNGSPGVGGTLLDVIWVP